MILNEGQRVALSELAKVGFGRAAEALSVLTGQRITVHSPVLKFAALPEVIAQLMDAASGEVVCVDQPFTGPISGNGLLIMDPAGAARLSAMFSSEPLEPGKNPVSADTLAEVGNILLNACLGVFDNLLRVPVTFAVPLLSVENVGQILRRVSAGDSVVTQALLVRTRIELVDQSVWGHLVIMPRPASLELLIRKLAHWEGGGTRVARTIVPLCGRSAARAPKGRAE